MKLVTIPTMKWHEICHQLHFDAVDRKEQFQDYFACVVRWKSNLNDWDGKTESRPETEMVLNFDNASDAVMFVLKWL